MTSTTNSKPDDATVTHQTARLPKQKLTALARLKSFGGSFIPHKQPSPVVFPPPSWELSDELLGQKSSPSLLESNFDDPPSVEPISFAQRLRGLIEALPLPGISSSSTQATPQENENEAELEDGKQGSPVPPGVEPALVRLLSSEDVMNGRRASTSNEEDKSTPGIWNILAGLKSRGGNDENPTNNMRPGVVEEGEDGVMMYAPLEPKSDSQLELASSETILEYVDEPTPSTSGISKPPETQAGGSTNKPTDTVIEKHVWVPSTTHLSLLTTWWGYRLYLPPPVMEKLGGSSVKATARAAMITTALKWLLAKIPILLVPVQFRPAVKLLKQLSPVVGYIGVFIAWSWDRVRACDNGNGVVLTATWLLPVALVPMTWDAGDIYGPRVPKNLEDKTPSQEDDKSPNKDQPADKEKPKPEKKNSLFRW
ncbi:hypothetical protein GALMADRAFT_52663 [Galerina marginata CBS 339.88]|uniref:Uncharacterized protein n=1 Tax=Galerina marginata (strain CBS 339.88) TaxID=685588 RepID=A0A067TQT5_GALM3|nr:hypothetical protein GALMADRAFT_52663 [Galerina marginata CBS 339.88]